ncbi:TetR/AcrR family transcriptional regulator [Mycolicibacterium palauense]|uniref:TetR/AcrR family transcriptional regulator n=1 Tax=Mycolicibacterium palauense TaxID=2034511 RepID=UPI000BFF0367|nr:TetR/AcrR family transcriptional regulator [Mycolicibacterium palauense]
MSEPSTTRPYHSPVRRRRAGQTRENIVAAGGELVRGFDTWDWDRLTFRAVAERAGVAERTVYRHFPTERHLRDAVMAGLEGEAGIDYDDVDLTNLSAMAARIFAALQRFSAKPAPPTPDDPTFVGADRRRREVVLRAVTETAPHWTPERIRVAAALLDVLWSVPAYERLVTAWELTDRQATAALSWLLDEVATAIRTDAGPPPT